MGLFKFNFEFPFSSSAMKWLGGECVGVEACVEDEVGPALWFRDRQKLVGNFSGATSYHKNAIIGAAAAVDAAATAATAFAAVTVADDRRRDQTRQKKRDNSFQYPLQKKLQLPPQCGEVTGGPSARGGKE
jgi:hypothetical protein